MAGNVTNKPRILRGAFVEYGLLMPPSVVVFQFNPVQLSRNRRLSFSVPDTNPAATRENNSQVPAQQKVNKELRSLRSFHQKFIDLQEIQKRQIVDIQEEDVSFEIRLDATDKLNEGDPIVEQYGIAPQLATLEAMMLPKKERVFGAVLSLLAQSKGHSYTQGERPPIILFIWGRKRVLPVNMTSMQITETEFSPYLNPIRATVSVNVTVIEGPNPPYLYTRAAKEAMSMLHLANLTEIVDVVVPG